MQLPIMSKSIETAITRVVSPKDLNRWVTYQQKSVTKMFGSITKASQDHSLIHPITYLLWRREGQAGVSGRLFLGFCDTDCVSFWLGVSAEQPAGMSGRGRLLPATEAGRRFASNLTEATLHDNPDGLGCKVEFEFIKIARKIAMPKQQTMDWEVIFELE